ncbi:15464_t:CDS:2 [Entrophospora sp. SA101]|nr:15457_t:CDS:2 [Entrophospora sp. SA101]CAJ0627178.1 15464_t:CDS:2 [Entrophospora sp. SA101]CAJ0823220.1 10697_t:CDS:2 [Entrophospora sp. SA101]CAJ0854281.1 7260_t:CDS:2 [Entrophospora sp. SA101]
MSRKELNTCYFYSSLSPFSPIEGSSVHKNFEEKTEKFSPASSPKVNNYYYVETDSSLISTPQISTQNNNNLCHHSSQSKLFFDNKYFGNVNDRQRTFSYDTNNNTISHDDLSQNTTNDISNSNEENRNIKELENDALEMLIRLRDSKNDGSEEMDIGNENQENYKQNELGYSDDDMEINSRIEMKSDVGINKSHLEIDNHNVLGNKKILSKSNRGLTNNTEKPLYSYASLIGQAILQSPRKKLIVSDIFKWISNTYPYYSTIKSSSWKTSIRHNLSKHEMFIRVENDNSSRACWSVNPDSENCFVDGVFHSDMLQYTKKAKRKEKKSKD